MITVIASGKGGVGKTVSAINIGMALSAMDEQVIIVDGNLSTPNVGLHLGAPLVPVTLNHVLNGKANVEEAIYEHDSGCKIIPSSLSVRELPKIKYNSLGNVAKNLKKMTGHVIIDSPAGLGEEALSVLKVADSVVIITNPDMPSVTDALKTIKVAQEFGKDVRGVILTRVKGIKSEMSLENISEMLEVPILGIVPEDAVVPESIAMKGPVLLTHPRSKASKAYRNVAAKLLGKKYVERRRSWFSKIIENLGL